MSKNAINNFLCFTNHWHKGLLGKKNDQNIRFIHSEADEMKNESTFLL